MAPHSVDDSARSFERHLRAGNKSPRTVETHLEAVNQFAANNRYCGLHAYYRWLEDEEEIPHPMRKLGAGEPVLGPGGVGQRPAEAHLRTANEVPDPPGR